MSTVAFGTGFPYFLSRRLFSMRYETVRTIAARAARNCSAQVTANPLLQKDVVSAGVERERVEYLRRRWD